VNWYSMTRVLADYGESLFNQSKAHSGPDEQPATSAGEIAEPCTLLFGEDDDLGDHGEFYEDDAGEDRSSLCCGTFPA
jgi:hypothetical protein